MNNNRGLVFAIVFASIVVSGSLVFFGMQFVGGNGSNDEELQARILEGIDTYVEKQQDEFAKNNDNSDGAKDAPKVEGDFADDDPFLGNEDAPVTIVEFSDYECPFCTKFFNNTLPEIKEKYVKTGKVKFVYRDFPLSFHEDAYPYALIAECAREQGGDEVYFAVHDKIFGDSSGFDFEKLSDFASGLGVDKQKLSDCYESDKYKGEIYKDMSDGTAAGVTGTPGFFINGTKLSGAQPFSVFEKVIEEELT